MDPKATAKSKRSHSLHGRRNSPHSTPAPTKDKKKQPHPQPQKDQQKPARQGGERPPRASLPSNWDRYEEEDSLGQPFEGGDGAMVKSKGADFGDLIEHAKSKQKDVVYGGGVSSFFDDSVPGTQSNSTIQGKSLLQQCGNDNFVMDDDSISCFEVPFLSLDFEALSSKLAKLKLSERIFIDPKYVPEEIETDVCDEEFSMQATGLEKSSRKVDHDPLSSRSVIYSDKEGKNLLDGDISSSTEVSDIMPEKFGRKSSSLLSSSQDTTSNPFTSAFLDATNATGQQKNEDRRPDLPSTFGVVAEEELDMLLDSFAEAKPFNTSGISTSSSNNNSASQRFSHGQPSHKNELPSKEDLYNLDYTEKNISLESTVDELIRAKPFCSSNVDADPNDTFFREVPPQNHASSHQSLEDTIDDLLAETSAYLEDQKHQKYTQSERKLNIADNSTAKSHFVPEGLDDFDSWLDTL